MKFCRPMLDAVAMPRSAACARASTRWRTGPHCMKMMGWWPSLRATVADRPRTCRAFARRAASSKLDGREVMALVKHQMTIIGHQIGHLTSAHETLDQRNIDDPVGLRRPPPMTPICFGSISRNVSRRSTHWSSNSRRWTRISVFRARALISAAATTVLPKAVVAASTPKSCGASASKASFCGPYSAPWKLASVGSGAPDVRRSSTPPRRHGRGSTQWPRQDTHAASPTWRG